MPIGFQVSFDANDPAALGAFWGLALGYVEQPPPTGFDTWEAFAEANDIPAEDHGNMYAIIDPQGPGRLLFQKVPEGKSAKNRLHLDVNVGQGQDWSTVEAHATALVEAGGTLVEERRDAHSRWIVMTDPEGNELCLQ